MFGYSQGKVENVLKSISRPKGGKSGYPIKRVLEIGCADGSLVECLREDGFLAEGIDLCPRKKSKYIHRADARDLYAYFGKRKFDAIVACGVLCAGGQTEALMLENPRLARELEKKREEEWSRIFGKICYENTINILRNCYLQLTNPGVFIDVEQNMSGDRLSYSVEDVVGMGFRPFFFGKSGAILIKED